MNNLLISGNDQINIQNYLQGYFQTNKIAKNSVIAVEPETEQLTIEQIRQVISLASRKYSQPTAFVIYSFGQTKELAQNVFLKALEEHQASIYFILITHSLASILPTITSRCQIVRLKPAVPQLNTAVNEQIKNVLETAQANPAFLLSEKLNLTPKNKRETVLTWLTAFLTYGYLELTKFKNQAWLAARLTQAIEAKRLIEKNNLDSELALNNIFL